MIDKNLAEVYRSRSELWTELRAAENPKHREVIEIQIKALDRLIDYLEGKEGE